MAWGFIKLKFWGALDDPLALVDGLELELVPAGVSLALLRASFLLTSISFSYSLSANLPAFLCVTALATDQPSSMAICNRGCMINKYWAYTFKVHFIGT